MSNINKFKIVIIYVFSLFIVVVNASCSNNVKYDVQKDIVSFCVKAVHYYNSGDGIVMRLSVRNPTANDKVFSANIDGVDLGQGVVYNLPGESIITLNLALTSEEGRVIGVLYPDYIESELGVMSSHIALIDLNGLDRGKRLRESVKVNHANGLWCQIAKSMKIMSISTEGNPELVWLTLQLHN